MDIDQVRNRVRHIDNIRADDEAAHAEEDQLHQLVLEYIAQGAPRAAELAQEALKTGDIDFNRWCA